MGGVVAYAYSALELPRTPAPLQTTQVLDVQGRPIGDFHATVDRIVIPLAEMPEHLRAAVLAAEDSSFYDHAGVDPIGIVRAAWADVRAGAAVQGGSTITEQLVKGVYAGRYVVDPETGERTYATPPRTIAEKVREALLALKLERELSKDQILARYLNTIYFGRGAYGVQAAAQTYWGKDASRLSVLQSATLAAAIQSPSRFDPATNPDDALARRNWVLGRMVSTGALDPDEAARLEGRPVRTRPAPAGSLPSDLGYFLDYTRRDLFDRFGEARVYGGGLEVRTTLDLDWQRAAQDAVARWLPNATDPEAAVVALDPASGAVRVMVGGRDFNVSNVNLATGQGGSGRQAGSAFKPFTLVAAIEQGYSLWERWNGPASITIPDERCYTDGGPWTLSNASDEESGVFTLRDATAHSVNTVYAQIASAVGPESIVDVAHRMGISSDLSPYCSITLGTEAVNPLEMTTAYATLAARGIRHDATPIEEIGNAAGRELARLDPRGEQVIATNDADVATYALESVVTSGTGYRARLDGRTAAGKTGTAQDYVDAWFCGYTPQLATCVWVGYPDAERPLEGIGGFSALYGGTIPALIWHDVMTAALDGEPAVAFAEPDFSGYALGPSSPVPEPSPTPDVSVFPYPDGRPTGQPGDPGNSGGGRGGLGPPDDPPGRSPDPVVTADPSPVVTADPSPTPAPS